MKAPMIEEDLFNNCRKVDSNILSESSVLSERKHWNGRSKKSHFLTSGSQRNSNWTGKIHWWYTKKLTFVLDCNFTPQQDSNIVPYSIFVSLQVQTSQK